MLENVKMVTKRTSNNIYSRRLNATIEPRMTSTGDRVATGLMAGAATVDITPAGSVFLYGYPHVPRFSTGVHDPLECAALYLRNGSEAVLFLAHDVIYFTKAFVTAVRSRIEERTGIPAHAILISATHTHSGPIMADHLSNAADAVLPKVDASYLAWLSDRIVAAADAAIRSAVPAEIGFAIATASGVGTNRHDPSGPADHDVPVMIVRAVDDQKAIGCMLVYAMHPTVLHEDSTLISADFPFFTRDYLRRSVLPPDCPIVYHNGASGNQSPRHVTKANTFAEAQRLGENLGRAITAVYPKIVYRRETKLSVRQRMVDVVPRTFPSVPEALVAVERSRETFAKLQREGAARTAVRTAECDVFGAEETAELARAAVDGRLVAAIASCQPAEIQLVAIDAWRFVAWPGEFFVEYGLAVRARVPGTFVITLANGELQGYIVTPEAAARGVYESTNAVFAARNGDRFVEATLELIKQAELSA
jgi:neutral ceramidase